MIGARPLGCVKLDRRLEALELVGLGLAAREIRAGAAIDCPRDQDLAGLAADCARAAVLTTVPIAVRSRCDRPNSPKLRSPQWMPMPTRDRRRRPRFRPASALARQRGWISRAASSAWRVWSLVADREIEDRHDGIADRLVEQPVMLPDGARALVVKGVEHLRHRLRRRATGRGRYSSAGRRTARLRRW